MQRGLYSGESPKWGQAEGSLSGGKGLSPRQMPRWKGGKKRTKGFKVKAILENSGAKKEAGLKTNKRFCNKNRVKLDILIIKRLHDARNRRKGFEPWGGRGIVWGPRQKGSHNEHQTIRRAD